MNARSCSLVVKPGRLDGYLELMELREDLAVSNVTLASRQATLGLGKRGSGSPKGVISELDVRQFEADRGRRRFSERGAVHPLGVAAGARPASVLVGRPPAPVSAAGTLDPAVAAITVPDSIPSALLLRRPDVLSAERDLAAATERVGQDNLVDSAVQVIITGEYGRQSPSTTDVFGSEHEIYTLQAGVSMPLFAGGRQKSELDAARARVSAGPCGLRQGGADRTGRGRRMRWSRCAPSATSLPPMLRRPTRCGMPIGWRSVGMRVGSRAISRSSTLSEASSSPPNSH